MTNDAKPEVVPPVPGTLDYVPHYLENEVQQALKTWVEAVMRKHDVGRCAATTGVLSVLKTMPSKMGMSPEVSPSTTAGTEPPPEALSRELAPGQVWRIVGVDWTIDTNFASDKRLWRVRHGTATELFTETYLQRFGTRVS